MMGLCLQLIDDDLFDFCCNFNIVNVKLIASNIDIRKISVLEVAFGYVVEGCHFLCHCFDFQIILLLNRVFLILVFISQAFVVHCKVEIASCEQMFSYPEPQRPGKKFLLFKEKIRADMFQHLSKVRHGIHSSLALESLAFNLAR